MILGQATRFGGFTGHSVSQQETGGVSDAQPTTNLQRKYVVLPVPEHVDPDGTIKEAKQPSGRSSAMIRKNRSYSLVVSIGLGTPGRGHSSGR